ncbi:MAG: Type II secretion system protein E (GspE) [Candidatus Amesbacteria bacterium GW2011_GWB1_47_26]|uniref:Type II secretion system protein E (GspE) n=1 Tax=Candidatus Amesbacteria bacterium GW2011_GWC2_45_19 TaxID=1618366 RepID=A0A0G1Q1H4_9BACT|nr:MAG: Type II secretion system protein E (GspE) [Candidatus Amesbacteria bacterium GW2011_GWC2_45_19]KKU37925.1 MAG: Type II secretion system protein E (GspE) [Candidatus Amesbacteria bacterium GW2011_GWA1_46_35]KKU69043.1 MAG: Type II secretion system protein E (GspE) [Microgenomates group bacterium GW2011_GWC1_47_20]KKU74729.1 MAG: Type II secretion system protein E (GspE) [Candidatus Amesbacteria bacterium GW2011_GWB1_47_26]KKU79766.1 MAG: Type II secretion system protein E (GspE) [Candida
MAILPDDQLVSVVVKAKLLDAKKAAEILKYAKNSNIGLDDALLEKAVITDERLGQALAAYFKLPFVNLSKLDIPEEVFGVIPDRVTRKQKMVVFARDAKGVKVAVADPATSQPVLEMVAKKTGQKVLPHLATLRDIQSALRVYQGDVQKIVDNLLAEDIGRTAEAVLEDPPVARIVDAVIETAYQNRASDIHIEPEEGACLVRYRIDGVLQEVMRVPKRLHERIMTRIKVLSSLRTDEHMAAQDGKMRAQLDEENLDIRVSILPIADGEKAVLRLLSSRSRQYTLHDLGMSEADLAKLTRAFGKSYGAILCTGPTGSGKTTTIYAILKIINTREKNITTIEDPVEYRIRGANQIQVNPKTNLTFASGLRSILRQDPNVIFVGEIRDGETAGIAINAALTGHLVLSTLHTNDAATAIPRLIDMKVEPFLVASTVSVILAQRLVRQICPACKYETEITVGEMAKNFPPEIIKENWGAKNKYPVFKGKGCKICRLSGYQGRVGLFEVLEVTGEIRKLITGKADADVIARAAKAEGMKTILGDGFAKIAAGVTTVEEVLRVTKAEFV